MPENTFFRVKNMFHGLETVLLQSRRIDPLKNGNRPSGRLFTVGVLFTALSIYHPGWTWVDLGGLGGGLRKWA